MAKKWISALLVSLVLFTGCSVFFPPEPDSNLCHAWWRGEINPSFVERIESDIARIKDNGCKQITVELLSPGGSVIAAIEAVRVIHSARAEGLIVELHGSSLVASAGTAILAAGTPGHRFVHEYTLTIIHAMKSGYAGTCVQYTSNPTNEEEKIANQLLDTFVAMLARDTGNSIETVKDWLKCNNEQVGDGWLLLRLGFADTLDR